MPFGYLVMMAIANVCYLLGWLSETVLKPRNPDSYRKVTFRLGLCFSIALPFLIPLILALQAIFNPEHFLNSCY